MIDRNTLLKAFQDAALPVQSSSARNPDMDDVRCLVERFEICQVVAGDEETKNELAAQLTEVMFEVAQTPPATAEDITHKMEAVEMLCDALRNTDKREGN